MCSFLEKKVGSVAEDTVLSSIANVFLLPMKFWVLLHLEHNTFCVGLSYFSSFYWLIGIVCWDLVCLLSSYRTVYPQTCRLAGHLGIIKHTGLKSWLPSALFINAE